jgi:hypothetical protein
MNSTNFSKETHRAAIEDYNHVQSLRSTFIEKHTVDNGDVQSHLSNALIKITPVELKEPTMLFGADTKTLVSNKISVHKAVINTATKEFTAGDIIMEAFISDADLSQAMFQANGPERFPCTYSNFFGKSIPLSPYHDSVIDRNNDQERETEFSVRSKEISALMDSILAKNGNMGKKDAEQLEFLFKILLGNSVSNINFQATQLVEEMQSKMTGVKLSLNANIHKLFYQYKNLPLLDNLSESDTDGDELVNYILDNGALKKSSRLAFKDIYETLDSFKSILDVEDYDSLCKLAKNLSNDVFIAESELIKPSNGAISMLRTGAPSELFAVETQQHQIMNIRFHQASYSHRYTSKNLDEVGVHGFLDINIDFENLLLLTRGNLKDDFIPCTIEYLMSNRIPFKKILFTEKEDMISDFKTKIKWSAETLQAHKNIITTLRNGVKGKKGKEDFALTLDNFMIQIEKDLTQMTDESHQTRSAIVDVFKSDLRQTIDSSIQFLDTDNPKYERIKKLI